MAQFMGGRFLLGFGVSYCCIAAPTYVSELAHPKVSLLHGTGVYRETDRMIVERHFDWFLQLHVVRVPHPFDTASTDRFTGP